MSAPSTTAFRAAPEHGAGLSSLASTSGSVPEPAAIADELAGFWMRLGAYLIDLLILAIAWALVAGTVYAGLNATGAGLGFLALAFFYSPIMWAYNDGATWGMQALGQRAVVRADRSPIGLGRALAREVARAALGSMVLPSLISAVMIGVRKDKRALHDLMAGTAVVKKRPESDHM
jgi:uncharacterized RDD family membrane protein YckC